MPLRESLLGGPLLGDPPGKCRVGEVGRLIRIAGLLGRAVGLPHKMRMEGLWGLELLLGHLGFWCLFTAQE